MIDVCVPNAVMGDVFKITETLRAMIPLMIAQTPTLSIFSSTSIDVSPSSPSSKLTSIAKTVHNNYIEHKLRDSLEHLRSLFKMMTIVVGDGIMTELN